MDTPADQEYTVTAAEAGKTLAAALRTWLPAKSWSDVRQLITARHVRIGTDLCLDPARRVKEGEQVTVAAHPARKPRTQESIVLRYLDRHVVVVEKPSGLSTVRHPSERDWNERRKALSPTLEDLVPRLIALQEGSKRKGPPPRLRIVQRLDKETSGLIVFPRTEPAERGLGKQFRAHTVMRRYLAIIPGTVAPQTLRTRLVRDRGDGRRGSTTLPGVGKEAVTHIEPVEKLAGYSVVACRLETGRTHQIRIHLAELGHPVCGEQVYNRLRDGTILPDTSGAPRLALHAAELGFEHPLTGETLQWSMDLPPDLQGFLEQLRSGRAGWPRKRSRDRDQVDGH